MFSVTIDNENQGVGYSVQFVEMSTCKLTRVQICVQCTVLQHISVVQSDRLAEHFPVIQYDLNVYRV